MSVLDSGEKLLQFINRRLLTAHLRLKLSNTLRVDILGARFIQLLSELLDLTIKLLFNLSCRLTVDFQFLLKITHSHS